MNKDTKILCICNKGNCRSVGTRYCLNERGYKNVIAMGGENTTLKTMAMLCRWADIILLAKKTHIRFIPILFLHKVVYEYEVGEDVYDHNPMDKKLHKIVRKQLDKIKLI